MAVTITAADLATAIGKKLEIATRLLPVASILVERYAPNAPTEIQNEAVIRTSGWLGESAGQRKLRLGIRWHSLGSNLTQVFAFRPSSLGALRGSGAMACCRLEGPPGRGLFLGTVSGLPQAQILRIKEGPPCPISERVLLAARM